MRIIDLYTKNRKIPWVTTAVIFCCVVVTMIAVVFPDTYEVLAWNNSPEFLWQYVSGEFLHGDGSGLFALTLMHFLANALMFVPYAIIAENIMGHKKFAVAFLCTWIWASITFQVLSVLFVPAGEEAYGAGLSGSSYAITVMGVFVLFRVFLKDKRKFFTQPLSYVFISGLIGELVFLSPAFGELTMILHISGIFIGIVLCFIFKNTICRAVDSM